MTEEELRTRIHLSLKLGALGDRLGSTLEGIPISERHVDWQIGTLTDDTVLTLATAKGIVDAARVDPEAIAQRFVQAFRARIPGLGSSTYGALTALAEGQHWALAGISGERAAGNGAAMRIAPVALVLDLATDDAKVQLRDIARITHRNDEASIGALALGLALRHALLGTTDRQKTLAAIAADLPDTHVRDQMERAASSNLTPDAAASGFGSSGYVAESVPLAIYLGFSSWADAKTALETAAMISEDADTVASMVGQILGAAGHDVPNTDSLLGTELHDLAADLAAISIGPAEPGTS